MWYYPIEFINDPLIGTLYNLLLKLDDNSPDRGPVWSTGVVPNETQVKDQFIGILFISINLSFFFFRFDTSTFVVGWMYQRGGGSHSLMNHPDFLCSTGGIL